MRHRFAEIAFTPSVRRVQEELGSPARRWNPDAAAARGPDALGPDEAAFLGGCDECYLATVGETGWPYVQHRGGPAGFVRVLDPGTIGFADFRGNRQYVTVGNLAHDGRVALLFIDHATQTRLKVLGRARIAGEGERALLDRLEVPGYRARVERGVLVAVEAFDWNCSQHIAVRFTPAEIEGATAPLRARVAELEAQLARLRREERGR